MKTFYILIIKFGATGDVLRTTTILHGLKREYPQAHITWIVEDKRSFDLLKNNQFINNLVSYEAIRLIPFKDEKFDLLISLDEDPHALALASATNAKEKLGYGLDEQGQIKAFNPESQYAFQLRISDDLKFRKNQKTYQQIIFEMARLHYKRDPYILAIDRRDKTYAEQILKNFGVAHGELVIGLNTGAGPRFAFKSWTVKGYLGLVHRLKEQLKCKIMLLGGPEEEQKNREIVNQCKDLVLAPGTHHSITQFAALVDQCHLIVSGDTVGMHIGIALKKSVIAIFGPTCPQEIDLYDRGIKIVSPIECAPCYKNFCDFKVTCMDKILIDDVYNAICKLLPQEAKPKI